MMKMINLSPSPKNLNLIQHACGIVGIPAVIAFVGNHWGNGWLCLFDLTWTPDFREQVKFFNYSLSPSEVSVLGSQVFGHLQHLTIYCITFLTFYWFQQKWNVLGLRPVTFYSLLEPLKSQKSWIKGTYDSKNWMHNASTGVDSQCYYCCRHGKKN